MLLWQSPTSQQISAYLQQAIERPWSYSQIGATRHQIPHGFDHDRSEIDVGHGWRAFAAARQAIRDWAMFPAEMSRVYGTSTAQEPGQVVAVLLKAGPVLTLGACRIVYRLDMLRPELSGDDVSSARASSVLPTVRSLTTLNWVKNDLWSHGWTMTAWCMPSNRFRGPNIGWPRWVIRMSAGSSAAFGTSPHAACERQCSRGWQAVQRRAKAGNCCRRQYSREKNPPWHPLVDRRRITFDAPTCHSPGKLPLRYDSTWCSVGGHLVPEEQAAHYLIPCM